MSVRRHVAHVVKLTWLCAVYPVGVVLAGSCLGLAMLTRWAEVEK